MAAFFQYARNITYYLLFAALAGMAAPAGKYKKYVGLVTGLVMVSLILQPLRALLNEAGRPVTEWFAGMVPVPMNTAGTEPTFEDGYDQWRYDTVRVAFEEQLHAQLSTLLAQNGYTLQKAAFEYDDDFSRVSRVTAEVSAASPAASPTHKPFIRIEPVKISVGTPEGTGTAEDETAEAVKKLIADFYATTPEHIHVRVRT